MGKHPPLTAVAAVVLACCQWPVAANAAADNAAPEQQWPDTYVARLQALALVQTLNAELLGSRSATLTLESWCRSHDLAAEPRIVADLVKSAGEKPPTEEQRTQLQVAPGETVKYRHVELRCGERVLSEADNWYVPARLTPEMNRQLETTNTPFGRAVQPLEPYRQTLAVKMLWSPLPEGWETRKPETPAAHAALPIPESLFRHRALLYTRDHKPFSLVEEVYKRPVLGAQPPPQP